MSYLFTSESVSEGHPDKLCDQLSDAILDACLAQDPASRVAAECFTTTGMVLVGGEITTKAHIDVSDIARRTIADIGYTNVEYGLDAATCAVMATINEQSPDIAQGVNVGEGLYESAGAGDQGLMFGYACNQTDVLMPLPIYLSHKVMKRLADLRKSGQIPYLRPDAKAQITVEYEGKQPLRIDTVVVSTQHDPDVDQNRIRQDVINQVIREVVPAELLDDQTRYFINPTGRFVVGGPQGDAGLTGRKIIVDTYGGWARHGGGAFSGKDGTKVDRSAAYTARYIAKNIVAAQLADEAEIQLAYAIGVAEPVSIRVNTHGTARIDESRFESIIRDHFELTPTGIIQTLGLNKPLFSPTAAYGHFGRDDLELKWEQTDKAEALQRVAKSVPVTQ